MKATHLRSNLFKVLDQVARTGQPIEIESKGRRFKIAAVNPPDRFSKLQRHPDVFSGDLDELAKIDWASEWQP